ncbi:response regulator receiver modulated metal dependent phosphohydrolase [Candidatus Moduliflexus flocculans]|uniref:Response regulator receiver modulated metal dependent phosphohydrolase n=1 Tax=Candidatus Moduliflexus flocculans TaxID=1499966 RepID=A0A0S6W1C0_9BACT|nr:response regulator receiver modulated metal dependent phosphohydrolase [Candidatus Moduliflexus flocculans]
MNKEPIPTIMIVDDTPANLNLLEEMLSGRGYEVNAFPHGKLALSAAAQSPPDLILLDVMMPDLDGFEVCRQLKTNPATSNIPVIFISALDDTYSKVNAFKQGGMDYITKPFQEAEVQARVKTHLKMHLMQAELEKHNQHLEELVHEKVREISDSQLATLVAISSLSEYRDGDTGQHIERTRTFCQILAQKLREEPRLAAILTDDYIENLYHAAPLHDIGKIGIPDHVLLKSAKLTPEEFEIMKTHVLIGTITLQRVRGRYPKNTFINMGIDIARSHHEKWNGTGYPDGISGENIPLSGRIMAIADVYDALRSKRPYKEPFSHERSVEIIQEGSGQHFDPDAVKAFLAIESNFDDISARMKYGETVTSIDFVS